MKHLNMEVCIYACLPNGEKTDAFNGDQSHLCTVADSNIINFKTKKELDQKIKKLSRKFFTNELNYEKILEKKNSIKCEINPNFAKNDDGMKNMTLEIMEEFNLTKESDIIWKAEMYLLDENFDNFSRIDDLKNYVNEL